MSIFSKQIIRCAIDVTTRDPFSDVFTGKNPSFWNSTDVEFQFAFFKGSGATAELLDVSNFQTVSIKVKDYATRTGAPFMNATVEAEDINTALTIEEWTAGTAQHVAITFPYYETDLPIPDGATSENFWIVVHGTTSDIPVGKDTFGASTLKVEEDGIQDDDSAPVQAGNLIPEGATYNGSGHYAVTLTAGRTYFFTKGANEYAFENGLEIIWESRTFIGAGSSTGLGGVPNALVTAVLRIDQFLSSDQTDARYLHTADSAQLVTALNTALAASGMRFKDGQFQWWDAIAYAADNTKPWRAISVDGGIIAASAPITT